ncbi:putative NBD/HSP70 family sugar kinase [Haloactinopolyspora alba]|uniref:Putative NBD/HSP70 family sugar kinase n=1 Tax=Haloactinopolyspora alba TaxID=648780 RepID=A0A2P8DRG2_9ACTN|nr:ROK family transcriptional regulator [Haloactinopolyspora alba]PSK99800.1 putative NBD/HSP70 family sugar kinase [Haloactinopolyspora alba]
MTQDAHPGTDALSAPSKAVAIEVLVHGPQSRTQLAHRLGLSAATLTRVVKPLVEAGILEESGAVRTPGRGRSSLPLDVTPERHRFIGVKLTTESIYAVVTDLRARILDQEVAPLRSLHVPDVVAAVGSLVGSFQSRNDLTVDAVGVTVGGRVDAREIVADSPFLHWRDVPFRSLLSQELGAPVHLDNDVVGLTKAQHWFGHGKGYADFALLTVGAGIGYGLVVNNTMVPTPVNPVSHFPVDPSGPLCPLGHRGCMTAYLTSGSITSAVSVAHGRPIGYDQVLELATADDPVASRVVREAAHALGRTAAAVSSLTGVQRIILSGEGVHLAEVAQSSVDEGLAAYSASQDIRSEPVIRPMSFLEWARGAAVIAIQAEFPRLPAAPNA